MSDQPKSSVQIREFPGLVTRVDRHDLPPGAAQIQTNVQSLVANQLDVRPGYTIVKFDGD